jgi:hypothetical protein
MSDLSLFISRLPMKSFGCAILLWCILNGCKYDDASPGGSEGIVLGQDFRMCMCCGGWLVKINEQSYHFEMPQRANISASDKFPLKVRLDWQLSNKGCGWIVVNSIQKL